MNILRRLRGLAVVASLWGGIWALLSLIPTTLFWLFFRPYVSGVNVIAMYGFYGLNMAVVGALCGIGFGLLFGQTARDGDVARLSVRRSALVGAVAGAVMPCLGFWLLDVAVGGAGNPLGLIASIAATSGMLGAIVSAYSVDAAKRAHGQIPPEDVLALSASYAGAPIGGGRILQEDLVGSRPLP